MAPAADARPDLTVASLSVSPTTVPAGGTITVTGSITNRGRLTAPTSATRVVLSRDAKRSADDVTLSQRVRTAALPRRRKAPLSVRASLPASAGLGTRFVIACANGSGAVRETTTRNNCRAVRITIVARGGGTGGGTTGDGGTNGGGTNSGPGNGGGGGGGGSDGGTETPPVAPPETPPPTDIHVGAAESVFDATDFLYEGANPQQRGVAEGTIEPERVFALRGRVTDAAGTPIADARVAIRDRAEFGYTLTAADGTYAMALNGGEAITIEVSKAGHLSVQRTLPSDWRDYGVADDIVLTPLDAVSSPIVDNAGPVAGIQVARGTTSTDADGSRRATLLFRPGTDATMTMPDGSTRPLTGTLGVRATEYTVGPTGAEAMPGSLPPTTAYTYAVEFSVDEAEAAGAVNVEFSQDVITYLENFIGAPVGTDVPMGWYDRIEERWKAGADGRVLEVISESGGQANLDVTGDGIADADGTLTALGIDADERKRVAELYAPGQELWRVPVRHFTPWDYNWPWGPDADAQPARQIDPRPIEDSLAKPCQQAGSIIDCESRVLGQAIPIAGTPFSLHYRADRHPGFRQSQTIDIPLTGASVPTGLKGIQATIDLGGQRIERTWCDPSDPQNQAGNVCNGLETLGPNVSLVYTWDGLDAFGRRPSGALTATITVNYIYRARYYGSDRDGFQQSFSNFPSGSSFFSMRDVCANYAGTSRGGSGPLCGISMPQTVTRELVAWDSRAQTGLGGWDISAAHAYDPGARTLYRGDGATERAADRTRAVYDIAGLSEQDPNEPRTFPQYYDQPALGLNLEELKDLAVAPDGSVYALSKPCSYPGSMATGVGGLRKITGATMRQIAGGSYSCVLSSTTNLGDGYPADDTNHVSLGANAGSVAVGADGTVYLGVADVGGAMGTAMKGYIRSIGADGIIRRVAGNGSDAPCSTVDGDGVAQCDEGVLATASRVGLVLGMGIAPDGAIYYLEQTDPGNGNRTRLRRIDTNGYVQTVAGGGPAPTGVRTDPDLVSMGETARSADLGVGYDMALAPDGTIYLATNRDIDGDGDEEDLIQRLAIDGRLHRFAGISRAQATRESVSYGRIDFGKPAPETSIGNVSGLDVAADGALFVRTGRGEPGAVGVDILQIRGDTINRIAWSTGSSCPPDEDGQPAFEVCLSGPGNGIAVAPDDTVYVTDGSRGTSVRRVGLSLPDYIPGSTLIASSDGSEVYRFDKNGRHLKTLDGLTGATLTTFNYDANARLTSIVDRDGDTTRISRDANGVALAVIAPGGATTTLGYDANGYLNRITTPAGRATTATYQSGSGSGLLASITFPGDEVHAYTYDGRGRLLTASGPNGHEVTLADVPNENGVTVTATTAEGRVTTYTAERTADGAQRRRVTEPTGAVTEIVIAEDGTTVQTDPDGTVTTTETAADPRWGARVSYVSRREVRLPQDVANSSEVSVLRRERTATLASPGNPLSATMLRDRVWYTDADTPPSAVSTTTWSSADRTLTESTPTGVTAQRVLDARGRTTSYTADTTYGLEPVTFTYDVHGNVTRMQQGSLSRTWTYDANDMVATMADGAGRTWTYTRDEDGALLRTTTPSGQTYNLELDPGGAVSARVLPRGGRHALTVTAAGDVASHTAPGAAAATTWTRSADRLVTSIARPGGITETIAHNAAGLPTTSSFPGGGTAIAYAANTDLPTSLTRSADGGAAAVLAFSRNGGVVLETTFTGPAAATSGILLDDRLAPKQHDVTIDGVTVSRALTRDADGAVTSIASSLGAFQLSRRGYGRLVDRITSGPAEWTYEQDANGRPRLSTLSVNGDQIYLQEVGYDAGGAIASRSSSRNEAPWATETYTRNADGRIVSVSGARTESWTWDQDGNRVAADGVSASYDSAGRLTGRGGALATSTAAGWLSAIGSDTYAYTARGELAEATVGGRTVSYRYDFMGRRVSRTDADGTTSYVYADPAHALRVTAARFAPAGGGSAVVSILTYDEIGRLIAIDRGPTRFYVATDHLGSPRAIVDASGATQWAADYAADGRETVLAGAAFAPPLGFAGGLRDPVTGLVRFGLRDYDPSTARFTTPDPSLFDGSPLGLYDYALGDPVSNIDPTGLFCLGVSAGTGLFGGFSACVDGAFNTSFCVESGVGLGGGLDIDMGGDIADKGWTQNIEMTVKAGPASFQTGIEFAGPCRKVSAKGSIGPSNFLTWDSSKGFEGPKTMSFGDDEDVLFEKRGLKLEGKATLKYCINSKPGP